MKSLGIYKSFVKRIFDICGSFLLIIMLFPLFIFLVALIAMNMGTPVLFRQKRPGRDGRIFTIYKFRTMNDKRNGDGSLQDDAYRLTALGKFMRKFSLDELPQLFNVLKGDLSFIGPRPLLTEYLALYSEEQNRRHHVRPGITGWAQVNGRNKISWSEKFALDLWYVDNVSFFLDMKILGMTIIKVLKSDGISSGSSATMEKFTGNESN